MNFESFESQRNIENLDIDKAFKKARSVLEQAIDPADFREVYDDVDSDLQYVERLEKTFAKEANELPAEFRQIQKMATILEGIIIDQGELAEWFGENATTIVPSRYDDIKNGVDCILEFAEEENGASHLALAVDVVAGPELQDKILRIINDINEGHLSEVKYLESAHWEKGEILKDVPKVVIGADRRHIKEILDLWLNNKKKELAEHHLQYQILKEIKMQLVAFGEYARKLGKEKAASTYKQAIVTINEILRNKSFGPDDLEKIEDDEVYRALKEQMDGLNREMAA